MVKIDRDNHAARLAQRAAATTAKRIGDIDPKNTTLDECSAALKLMFLSYPQTAGLGTREPAVYRRGEDCFMLTFIKRSGLNSEQKPNYDTGMAEGSFRGELLSHIPPNERPIRDQVQCINSLEALANAIVAMAAFNRLEQLQLPNVALVRA